MDNQKLVLLVLVVLYSAGVPASKLRLLLTLMEDNDNSARDILEEFLA